MVEHKIILGIRPEGASVFDIRSVDHEKEIIFQDHDGFAVVFPDVYKRQPIMHRTVVCACRTLSKLMCGGIMGLCIINRNGDHI